MRRSLIVPLAMLAALVASCATHPRPPLPLPSKPLMLTPDEPFRGQPPVPEAPHPWVFPEPEVLHLRNGLSVMLVADPRSSEVALDFASRNAGETGFPRTAGIASLTGFLLADSDNSEEPVSLVEERGLQFRPRISRDGGDFLLTTTTPHLEEALVHLSSALTHPTCREETLERLRLQYMNFLIQRTSASPEQLGVDLVRRRLYGPDHPLGQPPEGTRGVINGVTLDEVRRFCNGRLQPQDSALVVVGNTTRAALQPLLDETFGAWTTKVPAPPPQPPPSTVAGIASGNAVALFSWFGGDRSWLVFGMQGPLRSAPDYAPFLVITNLIADHLGGPHRAPREDRPATPSTHVWLESSGFGTTLFLTAVVAPGQEGQTAQGVLEELKALRTTPVTAEELAMAQSRFASSVGDAYATESDTAVTLGALFDARLPLSTESSLVARIQALTAEDIQNAAKTALHPEQSRIVVLGEPRVAASSLKAAGFKLSEEIPAATGD